MANKISTAAAIMGRKGGRAGTDAQNRARARNAKNAGRPALVEMEHYPQAMYLNRDDYKTAVEYRSAYRACCRHYGYKAKVEGGWKFFEFISDWLTWQNQK